MRPPVDAESSKPRSRFGALRSRNFALLWSGLIISNAGSWMQLVAQGWLVYTLTRSPFVLGLIGLSRAIPMIVLPPFGGAIADRVPRLKLLKVTQTLNLILALPLTVLVYLNQVQVWEVVVFSVLAGVVNSFDQPTRQALLPDLVEPEDLTSAVGLNSAAWQGSSLIGPSLAGMTIAAFGLGSAFLLNALSFLAVVAALFLMRDVPEHSASAQRRGVFQDVISGLHYVSTTRMIATLILLSAVTSMFGRSYQQLLPAFAKDVLHTNSAGLGFMTSMPGAGTLAAAFVLTAMGDRQRKGLWLLGSMVAFSLTICWFALTDSFDTALVLLLAAGVTSFVFGTMTMSMTMLQVPPQMRGRVMSLLTVTAQGFAPLGALFVGAAAERIGTANAVAGSAAIVGAAALVAVIGVPALRDAQRSPESTPVLAARRAP